MLTGPKCTCLVCRLETSLVAELDGDKGREEYGRFASFSPALSVFPTALALVERLHGHQEQLRKSSSDQILLDLLARSGERALATTSQKLLLLAFVPALHSTMNQIAAMFPSLAREDIAQHLFAVLLGFLPSEELRSRRSHLAFTIARKLRRSAFRWALRESRTSLENDLNGHRPRVPAEDAAKDDGHSEILLRRFLDSCESRGWLSYEERQLLTQFKLEQMSGRDLGLRSGQSPVAVRHRVQRLLTRLRRIARNSGLARPEQLDLFPR